MNFKREKAQNYYLWDTRIENVFINEYMVSAPGDYVKVYLLASMYVEIDLPVSNESLARELNLPVEDVLQAWTYWEKCGVVRKHYPDPGNKLHYQVEFLNLREAISGGSRKKQTKSSLPEKVQSLVDDEGLRKLYSEIEKTTGRLLSGSETMAVLSWIEDYSATPEVIAYAYRYCAAQRKTDKHTYVASVVKDWAGRGFRTAEEVEAFLAETDNRHFLYKRVLKALGFTRNATEEERRLMDVWLDDWGFGIDQILDACRQTSGISNPNFKYINSILSRWAGKTSSEKKEEENVLQKVSREYKEKARRKEQEAQARREEVLAAVPRIGEIEDLCRSINVQIAQSMLSGDAAARKTVRDLKDRAAELLEEKAALLLKNNFAANYMDMWYDCLDCKDTGTQDTGLYCHCFKARLAEAEKSV
ncbi:MAG: DnaD domain protein [Clostridiales bacterium]|nr:DnaD domain protein [Clostridiales bacterium]